LHYSEIGLGVGDISSSDNKGLKYSYQKCQKMIGTEKGEEITSLSDVVLWYLESYPPPSVIKRWDMKCKISQISNLYLGRGFNNIDLHLKPGHSYKLTI
jgi:hypothetical protein